MHSSLLKWMSGLLRNMHRHGGKRGSSRWRRPRLEELEGRVVPTPWTVNVGTDNSSSSGGSGSGTTGDLRYCLTNAGNGDTIDFDISTNGTIRTIDVEAALPAITQSITIDGTTEPAYAGTPLIHISGTNLTSAADGLDIMASNVTVKGLVINRFAQGNGIHLNGTSATGDMIVGNWIGTNISGDLTAGAANDYGILIDGGASNNNIIDNVISNNTYDGVDITDSGTSGNMVEGNYIGTDYTGAVPLLNGNNGITIESGASNNTIGGSSSYNSVTGYLTGAGNVISGNTNDGIDINASNSNKVEGNYIGLDITGENPVANGRNGITVENGASNNTIGGSSSMGLGNVIASNNQYDIQISGVGTSNDTLLTNNLGIDRTGKIYIGSSTAGLEIDGGDTATVGPNAVLQININPTTNNGAGHGLITGGGTLDLAGGATIMNPKVDQGITIQVTGPNATLSNINLDGTLDLNGFNLAMLMGLTDDGGNGLVTNTGALATLTVTGNGTFTGSITGANTALTIASGSETLSPDPTVMNLNTGLANMNTYGGLTTINSGATLVAGSSTALSPNSNVSDSGTLDLGGYSNSIGALNGSGIATDTLTAATLTVTAGGSFGGNLTGSLALAATGSSTLTLTGANNYSGGTSIGAGSTLQIGAGGTSGTLGGGSVIDNGALVFNWNNSVTVSNAISGSGTLTQAGPGTTILTRANSYSATTISAGALQIGNAGATGTLGSGTVTDNGALVFNRTNSIAVANAISGSGTLTQAGAGTTTLTATNNYTGATAINAGVLFVDSPGSILNTTTTVNTTGELAGTGTTGPVFIAGGAVKPGDSVGALTTNAVTFTNVSGGNIDIQLPATGAPGINYDQLVVTTPLTLNPSTATLTVDLNGLTTTGVFPNVIADSAGVSGTFGTVNVINNPNGWTVTEVYSSTGVSINVFGTASKLAFTVQPSTTTAGVAISPAVQVSVEDSFGTVIPTNTDQLRVAVASAPGGFTSGSTTSATAVAGVVTFSNLVLNTAGTYTLSASDTTAPALTGASSSSFVVNAAAASQLVYTTTAQTLTAGVVSGTLTVQEQDSFGNATTTAETVNLSTSNTATGHFKDNATGLTTITSAAIAAGNSTASFKYVDTLASTPTLTAAATGLASATQVETVLSNHLVFTNQPTSTTAGQTIAGPTGVQVSIENAFNQVVTTDTTTVTLTLSSGTLNGMVTVQAVNGVATFPNLSINTAATGYTLTGMDPGDAGMTSNSFNITPAAASQLVYTTTAQTLTAGVVSGTLTVQEQDSFGNATTTAETVNLSTSNTATGHFKDNATGLTTITSVSIAAGSSTASFKYVDTLASTPTLTAAATGLASAIQVETVASNHLVFTNQPTSTTAGQTIAGPTGVQVSIENAFNQVVTTDTTTVTLTLSSGTLNGMVTVQAVNGVATFPNLSINTAATGYTLTGTDPGDAGMTSNSFNITPAAASQLVYTTTAQTLTAGVVSGTLTVQEQDSFGNATTTAETVNLSTSNAATGVFKDNATGLTTITSVAIAAGNSTASFKYVDTLASTPTLTAAATGLASATQVETVNAAVGVVTHFAVMTNPPSIAAGAGIALFVVAEDANNNEVTSYSGTVTFTSSSFTVGGNTQDQTPAPSLAISGGQGFTAATLKTVGVWTITATAGPITGATGSITVTPAAASHFVVAAPSSTLTLNSTSFTVTAYDPYNNVATGYSGTVAFTSSDGAVSVGSGLPLNSTLVSGTGTFTATLKTPGSQTITATDASNTGITGNSNAIATHGLYVTSFATTPSGFTATFSKVVNLTTFDYYRFSASQSQAPDVAMATVGSATTNVNGTLLVSSTATQTTITFVATQGVLSNSAKYLATLTSGAGGIVDTSGEQLAGDANGFLPGTNYVVTNLAPASSTTPTLSIPGFARGPNSSANVAITTNSVTAVGIPVTLTHALANTTEIQFTLDFNPALLNVTGPTSGNLQLLNPATANSTGVANFEYNGPALGTTSAVLGDIVADVPNSAANEMLQKTLLDLPVADIYFNGSATPASPVQNADGVQVVDYLGETTNNFGVINSVDASNAQAVVTANTTPTTANQPAGLQAFPLADPYLIAGSTGSTTFKVVAADVTGLNRFAVSLSHPFIPTPPTGLTYSSPGPDPTVSLPTNLQVTAGGIVTVPVNIDDPRPAGSDGMTQAELALTYDPSVFSLTSADVQLGTVPASGTGWTLTSAVNPATGQIAIFLESLTPISSAAGGSLATIDFHVRPGATLGATAINLAASVNPTGNAVVWTRLFDSQQEFTLSPAPSNAVSAAGLDAMVVVTPVDAGTAEGGRGTDSTVTTVVDDSIGQTAIELFSRPPIDASAASPGSAVFHALATLLASQASLSAEPSWLSSQGGAAAGVGLTDQVFSSLGLANTETDESPLWRVRGQDLLLLRDDAAWFQDPWAALPGQDLDAAARATVADPTPSAAAQEQSDRYFESLADQTDPAVQTDDR